MRPEILFPLFAPVTSLKGVGPRVAPLLEKLAGPARARRAVPEPALAGPPHAGRPSPTRVDGQVHDLRGHHRRAPDAAARPAQPWRIRAFDETGFITLVFFGGFGDAAWRSATRSAPGAIVSRQGRALRAVELQMVHPDYMVAADKARRDPRARGRSIRPPAGLPPRTRAHASRWRRWSARRSCRSGRTPAWLARERLPGLARGAGAPAQPADRGRPVAASPAPPAAGLRRTAGPAAGHGPAQGRAAQASRPPTIAASDLADADPTPTCPSPSPAPRTAPWPRSAPTSPPASG